MKYGIPGRDNASQSQKICEEDCWVFTRNHEVHFQKEKQCSLEFHSTVRFKV